MPEVVRSAVLCVLALSIGGVLVAWNAAPSSAGASPSLPDADEIFRRARDEWSGERLPRFVKYVVVVRAQLNGHPVENHYGGIFSSIDERFKVDEFSVEERANPSVPHGINVDLAGPSGVIKRLSPSPPPTDYLGFPALAPRYSFGLERAARVSPATGTESPVTQLPVIGTVEARSRDYAVSLAATEPAGDRSAYHLRLQPLREPQRNRLRELWVDSSDFRTLKLVTQGNFTDGPALGVRWTIAFKTVDGAQFLDTETAQAPLVLSQRESYRNFSISFEDLQTSSSAPASQLLFFMNPNLDGDGALEEP